MRFYKSKYFNKTKIVSLAVILLIIVWAVNYIQINEAFPNAQEVIYTCKDILKIDGLNVELVDSELVDNAEEAVKRMSDENIILTLKKSKSDYRYIYVKLNIYNESDEDKNIEALNYNLVMECMPSGWSNCASAEYDKITLKPGESTFVKMVYALNIPENADISGEEFHLVYRTYPEKIMFVLDI